MADSNQQKALSALIECKSVAEASRHCGLSTRTLFRYLADPDFKAEYRKAGAALYETAITRLQKASESAADALERNLHSENPVVEVRAASVILDVASKGVELLNIAERLERLEAASTAKEG